MFYRISQRLPNISQHIFKRSTYTYPKWRKEMKRKLTQSLSFNFQIWMDIMFESMEPAAASTFGIRFSFHFMQKTTKNFNFFRRFPFTPFSSLSLLFFSFPFLFTFLFLPRALLQLCSISMHVYKLQNLLGLFTKLSSLVLSLFFFSTFS